jgi:hypothetical protein
MLVVIPIVIEFSPETFLHIMLELWIETENGGEADSSSACDINAETETDNKVTETEQKN